MPKRTHRRPFGNVRRLPSGRFQARYRHPHTGATVTAPETFPTRTDADDWLASVRLERAAGTLIDPADAAVALASVARRYRAGLMHLRPSSLHRTRGYIDRYILTHPIGEQSVGEITVEDVTAWVDSLRQPGRGRSGRGLAPSTIHKTVQTFAAVLDLAIKEHRRKDNPARGMKLPRIETEEMRFLTPPQIAAVADAIEPRYRDFVIVACYTGLRLGELVALTAGDVDLERRRVTVLRNLVEVNGRLHESHVKTAAGRRTVPLSDDAHAALARCVAATRHRDDLLFTSPRGGPIRGSDWRLRRWLPALAAAGLDRRTRIHDMRHTAISLWVAAGVDVKAVASWAGHRSVATVLDRYGHLQPDHAEAALAKINAYVAASSSAADPAAPIPIRRADHVAARS